MVVEVKDFLVVYMISSPAIHIPAEKPDVNHDKSAASEHGENVLEGLIIIRVNATINGHTDNENQERQTAPQIEKQEIRMPNRNNPRLQQELQFLYTTVLVETVVKKLKEIRCDLVSHLDHTVGVLAYVTVFENLGHFHVGNLFIRG